MTIDIENEYQGKVPENYREILENVVNGALDHEDCPYEVSVYVLLTDDEDIRQINREHRRLDSATDVLSFPMIDYEAPACFDGFDDMNDLFDPDSGELVLGDIIISMDHVYAQAESFGHSVTRELAFLCAHSMLHLMGYDHMDEEEREVMEQRQREILDDLGYKR